MNMKHTVHSTPVIKMYTDKNKDNNEGKIREGQEDSSIADKDLIKGKSYPGSSKKDKQFDNQEEFITPPVAHPGEEQ